MLLHHYFDNSALMFTLFYNKMPSVGQTYLSQQFFIFIFIFISLNQ